MRAALLVPLLPLLAVVAMPLLLGSATSAAGGLPVHPDIPEVAMAAYVAAVEATVADHPDCRPTWALLAAIGKIESNHGRTGGSSLDARGQAVPPILGVVLNGSLAGTRPVPDTDGGRLDGHTVWDRAVGPMQFLPGTWTTYGRDGDGDGRADPQQIADAAAAARAYLCANASGGIADRAVMRAAVFAYNRSTAYVDEALHWMDTYLAEATHPAAPRGTGPIECPVTQSVRFIDSWHFPRSGGRLHKGQDLFAPEGTPLVALTDGVITDIGHHRGLGGNVIWLQTGEGHAWYYAHLQHVAAGLHVGQAVRRGEVVGTVGRTGNAATTPPHLHIQWRTTGRRGPDVNPYDLLSAACPGHR